MSGAFRQVLEPRADLVRQQVATRDALKARTLEHADYQAPAQSGAVSAPLRNTAVTEGATNERIIRGVALPASGQKVTVLHGLGRRPLGHHIARSDGAGSYFEVSSDESTVVLQSTGSACTIDLWVR